MIRQLGRLPADLTRPALKASRLLTGVIPAHPPTVDYASEVPAWGMLGNDQYGVCGPAGIAHNRMQVTRYLTGVMVTPTLDDVFALYRRCNPGFDPATWAGDNGVVLQDMLGHVARQGFAGTKAVAFAQVDHTNLDEVRAAIAVFGSLLFGVSLEETQQTQTDNGGPWDYAPSAEWGAHAVLAAAYQGATAAHGDIEVVTWGEVMGTTDAFAQHQMDECWAVIWPEHLGSAEFQQGVDLAALAADYLALTGRDLPVPAPVPPTPAPPADPDRVLAAVLRHDDWVHHPHVLDNAKVAAAARVWLAAKNL